MRFIAFVDAKTGAARFKTESGEPARVADLNKCVKLLPDPRKLKPGDSFLIDTVAGTVKELP